MKKNLASTNVQLTCNSNERFTSVDASWPRSVHDSRIWKNSNVNVMQWNEASAVLLGDSGYGIAPWLITPFWDADTQEQRSYIRLFTRESVIIERCFGQLKEPFPILQHKIRAEIGKVPSLVMICFILHNVAKHLNDEDFHDDVPEHGKRKGIDNQNAADYTDTVIRQKGQLGRDGISRIIHGFGV